jgi:hypothetical protein
MVPGGTWISRSSPSAPVRTQGEEGVLMGDGDEPDVATAASDTAIRSTLGNVGLAAEAHTPATAVARFHEDLDPIDEHRGRL